MQTGKSTLERAIELARESSCRGVSEIRHRLKAKQHDQIEQHLDGKAIIAQLRKLIAERPVTWAIVPATQRGRRCSACPAG